MNKPFPSQEWNMKMADLEDKCESISCGGHYKLSTFEILFLAFTGLVIVLTTVYTLSQ